jgi:hypothetical protein
MSFGENPAEQIIDHGPWSMVYGRFFTPGDGESSGARIYSRISEYTPTRPERPERCRSPRGVAGGFPAAS